MTLIQDIELNGVNAGSTKHLPPTVSLQYHFRGNERVKPFIGAGLNYTIFFEEETRGPLAGTEGASHPVDLGREGLRHE